MDVGRWQELRSSLRDAEETIENMGRLQRFMALWNSAGGRVVIAYFDLVAAVCTWLLRGQTHFSRPIWIASCVLTSLGLVVASVFVFNAAPVVHDTVDSIAVLAYGTGETLVYLSIAVELVFDVLSHVIYWLIIALGVVVHVMMTVGSLIVGVGAVVLCVLGIYLALMFDPNILWNSN